MDSNSGWDYTIPDRLYRIGPLFTHKRLILTRFLMWCNAVPLRSSGVNRHVSDRFPCHSSGKCVQGGFDPKWKSFTKKILKKRCVLFSKIVLGL